jgi:putative membrane protein
MLVAGLVLAALGALVHGYIFWLEAVAWRGPRARRIFGTSEEEARVTAPLALNQGFYNLFLAVEVVVGIVLVAAGATAAGATAVLIGAGSMVAAGTVLVVSDRSKARAALTQAAVPAVAVLLIAIGLATS